MARNQGPDPEPRPALGALLPRVGQWSWQWRTAESDRRLPPRGRHRRHPLQSRLERRQGEAVRASHRFHLPVRSQDGDSRRLRTSFDTGVFGSIFGHTVTQNIPVLANQQIQLAEEHRRRLPLRRDQQLYAEPGSRQRSAAEPWLFGQLQLARRTRFTFPPSMRGT